MESSSPDKYQRPQDDDNNTKHHNSYKAIGVKAPSATRLRNIKSLSIAVPKLLLTPSSPIGTTRAITELQTTADFDAHISVLPPTTLLVLYFYTQWAAPCIQMTADLEMLASSYPVYSPPLTSWVSVDADKLLNITEAYNVAAVPFIVLAKDGKVLCTVRGCDAVKVGEAVEQHAGVDSVNKQSLLLP